jgi:hypothetical protein
MTPNKGTPPRDAIGDKDDVPWQPSNPVLSRALRLPFGFETIRRELPDHLEIRRFVNAPQDARERLWKSHRSIIPPREVIPKDYGLDIVHYRQPSEREYCRRLAEMIVPEGRVKLSKALICLPSPWVPHQWVDTCHFMLAKGVCIPTRVTWLIQRAETRHWIAHIPSGWARRALVPVHRVAYSLRFARSIKLPLAMDCWSPGIMSNSILSPNGRVPNSTFPRQSGGPGRGGYQLTCSYLFHHW